MLKTEHITDLKMLMWKLTLVSFSILCAKYPITNNQVSVFILTSFASYRRVVEKRPPLEFYSMSLYSKVTLRTTEMQQRATRDDRKKLD